MNTEVPLICPFCSSTNMVDLMNMESRPLSSQSMAEGYKCDRCKAWVAVYFSQSFINKDIQRLEKMDKSSRRYRKFFMRVAKDAMRHQHRMRNVWQEQQRKHGFP